MLFGVSWLQKCRKKMFEFSRDNPYTPLFASYMSLEGISYTSACKDTYPMTWVQRPMIKSSVLTGGGGVHHSVAISISDFWSLNASKTREVVWGLSGSIPN
jgi:hypothetical protein